MLGDTLLNVPALDCLKRAYPSVEITLVCHPSLIELLSTYPSIHKFISYNAGRRKARWREMLNLYTQLRERRFDAAVVSNSRKDFHMLTWLAGIPRRIGYARKWGFFLTDRVADRKSEGRKHEIVYNIDLLIPLIGLNRTEPVFHLPVSKENRAAASALFTGAGVAEDEKILAVHPFSSDSRKCWDPSKFIQLLNGLQQDFSMRAIIIGLANEWDASERIRSAVGGQVVNLAGKTTLGVLSAVLEKAVLLIGHDSGPMHLAAAVGVPTLSLFAKFPDGPNPVRWRPWGVGHTVIHDDLPSLGAAPVLDAARELLKKKLPHKPRAGAFYG